MNNEEPKIYMMSSLDCCKDPKCPCCHGTGYMLPTEDAIKRRGEG